MSYRARLLIAMTFVAVSITSLGLLLVERNFAAETEHDLEVTFQAELNALHMAREVRQAALAERCRALVGRPRILAALEDNALDLLYPSARDELRDLMNHAGSGSTLLNARFYRFLDDRGRVLPAENITDVGPLNATEESKLNLNALPEVQESGYLAHEASKGLVEIFAVPIISSETGERISALVVGLAPSTVQTNADKLLSGVLLNGVLHLPELQPDEQKAIAQQIMREVSNGKQVGRLPVVLHNTRHRLFYNLLNPGSAFEPAYEVCLFPLNALLARQTSLRWQAAGICVIMLLGGVAGSQFLAGRLSKPVEKLEIDSAANLAHRQQAEAALELTSQELQRAARFSSDASHQLKTPVTVLRAGLDELLADETLAPATREEISSLLHQTFRLNTIIEDLLLLSRMDAGHLKLGLSTVLLTDIVEAWLDDFSTLTDLDIKVETDYSPNNLIRGEKRYTAMIVENLLENARKYNRPGGKIQISTRQEGSLLILKVANNGRKIPVEMQGHIFERFHRGTAGENVPGYGLGLNLARELALLHGGALRLVSSKDDWTEFEVSFCIGRSDPQPNGFA
jgi:signal transduction histidine kinase